MWFFFQRVEFAKKSKLAIYVGALIAGSMLSQTAIAGSSDMLELIKVLRDNGTISQAQYQQLSQAMQKTAAKKAEEEKKDVKLRLDRGGLRGSTEDGQFSFRVGGRVQADAAFYDEDENDLGDGTELRRARIGVRGKAFGDWGYKVELDFADGAEIRDGYVAYNGFDDTSIKVGNFKEPFSLEELTSSNHTTFMERALPNTFAPGRRIGIGASTHGSGWTAAAGVFGEEFDTDTDNEGDEGWGASGRVTYAFKSSDTNLVHVGASGFYRNLDDDEQFRIRQRPESSLTNVRFVDTGTIDYVDDVRGLGIEGAAMFGPASIQGEYITTSLERSMSGLDDLDFDGFYIFGSYVLTGESRSYSSKSAKFGGIKPNGSMGAWEVALRYSSLDLTDGSVSGGEADQWTFGLNWYPNANTRVMANYVLVDNDEDADENGGLIGNDDPSVFQVRVQAHF